MRKDKDQARALRYQGKTFREISKELAIPVSTLSVWFRLDNKSRILSSINKSKVQTLHVERLKGIHLARRRILEEKYRLVTLEARKEYETYRNDVHFNAGLVLYVGCGDKRPEATAVRISGGDPLALKLFIAFSREYLKIEHDKVKFGMLLYSGMSESVCKSYWKSELAISEANFYKTQVRKEGIVSKRLIYGVGNITIVGKSYVIKLREWSRLALQDLNQ